MENNEAKTETTPAGDKYDLLTRYPTADPREAHAIIAKIGNPVRTARRLRQMNKRGIKLPGGSL